MGKKERSKNYEILAAHSNSQKYYNLNGGKRQRPDLNREILAETRFPVLRSTRLSHVGKIIVLEQ